jgi:hypothetical protein
MSILTVTLPQVLLIRAALAANAGLLWAKDGNNLTRVSIILFMDPKVGQLICSFASDADKPLVTDILAINGQIEVADITA